MTCLGRAGDPPPYHCTRALHSLSGTTTTGRSLLLIVLLRFVGAMLLPRPKSTSLTAAFSFPPSAVRLGTLLPVACTRVELSIGPGRDTAAIVVECCDERELGPADPFLECLGECTGVDELDLLLQPSSDICW